MVDSCSNHLSKTRQEIHRKDAAHKTYMYPYPDRKIIYLRVYDEAEEGHAHLLHTNISYCIGDFDVLSMPVDIPIRLAPAGRSLAYVTSVIEPLSFCGTQ